MAILTNGGRATGRRPAALDSRSALPAPKYRRVFGVGRGLALQYAVFVILALFVIAPIVPILYQSALDRPLYAARRPVHASTTTCTCSPTPGSDRSSSTPRSSRC